MPHAKRTPDKRVARGIWRTRAGWRLYVRVGGRLKPKRVHDPLHEIGLVQLKHLRDDHRTEMRTRGHLPDPTKPEGFAADVRMRYLPAVAAMPGIKERTRHMELWIDEFRDRDRRSIEPWEIRRVRDRWLTKGPRRVCTAWGPDDKKPKGCRTGKWIDVDAPLSASQVNSRLRALENFFTVMNGRHGPNPAREAGEAIEPDATPRALDYATIEAILAAMPDRGKPTKDGARPDVSLTKLRARVLAYTGFSHAELKRIGPADLHLDDPEGAWVWIGGRRKGKGTKGTAQPLTPVGADALRALVAANGLGPFSSPSMRQCVKRAMAKFNVHARVYDFRHSFATEVLRQTSGNIALTQMMMRHRDPRTTLRYAAGAVTAAKRGAVQALIDGGAFAGARMEKGTK